MKHGEETVFLVDASSYIHRAYHAIRGLASSNGLPTNAVFGFTKMILKLLEDKKPEYAAIVFDAKGPTFRHRLYTEYKANRPPMAEEMAVQIPLIKEVVAQLNLPMTECQGYEADDLIGTLAVLCEQQGYRVVMVTGDKDFRQLISPAVVMWDPMKNVLIDEAAIREQYGIEPEQFVDVMGLSGDTSDNIPGVPGVGEKTALRLIRQFGSLEEVFANVEHITQKKLKQNLTESREIALLSKRLVTIECAAPLDLGLEDLRVGEPRREELAATFRELEFRDLWDAFAARDRPPAEYELCLSPMELDRLTAAIERCGWVSIDTETTSPNPFTAELVGISFAWEEDKGVYLPLGHVYPGAPRQLPWSEVHPKLEGLLADPRIRKIGQNIKYDAQVLKRHGLVLNGIHFDTMVASYVINPSLRQHNLNFLAQHYLNHKMIRYEEVIRETKAGKDFAGVPVEAAMAYSCEDADITLRLMQVLERRLQEDQNLELFTDLEMRLVPVLIEMEMTGIKVDTDFLAEMSTRIAVQLTEIEQEIYTSAGMEFNINSPQQLGEVLFEKLQLPVQKKTAKTKRYSTDMKVLRRLSVYPHQLPKLVLRYRSLAKLKSTYLDALIGLVGPSTGRLHTSFNQTVTATGRLSSSNPNLQNIPVRGEEGREIRKAFVAAPGYLLLAADYSQIELRIFAHYSKDEAFLEAFAQDQDIHTRTAAEILGMEPELVTTEMRRVAKAINFGILYGMGPQRLSEELEIERRAASRYIDAYYERYQGVVRYRQEMIETAREKGYVTTLFNRRRYLPDIRHGNRVIRAEAERMAINTPIQGTAADLIKRAMIAIHNRLGAEGFDTRMLLQVHDELVFEVPAGEVESVSALIKTEMEEVFQLAVPLKVEVHVGANWGEAH